MRDFLTAPQMDQADSFDERVDTLAQELTLSIKWDRPCVIFAVYRSEYIREDAETALENYLIGVCQRPVRLSMGAEKENENIQFLLGLLNTSNHVFFINGADGSPESRAKVYSSLERHGDILSAKNIRIVFWLTHNEINNLARQAPELFAQRQRLVEFADAPKPEQILNKAIESAWQGTGEYTDEFEDTEEKISLHESFLMELPEDPESTSMRGQLLITLGILNWRKGDFEKAEELFKLALEAAYAMEDGWFEAECYNAIALVKTSQGKHDQAIDAYKQAIRSAPEQIFAWNNLGNLCLKIQRMDEAMVAFQKALEHNPKDPVAWNGLGNVYYRIGYIDDAITSYRKAIEHAPGLALPWNGLGDAYASVGRDVDAVVAYQKAVELNRNFIAPWLRLANIYSVQNRSRDAVKAYQRALQIDPKNAAVWNELGSLYMKNNSINEAAAAFSRAVELDRGNGRAYVNLAQAHAKLGRNEEAIKLCETSMDLLGDDLEKAASWNHLAGFYRNINEYDRAMHAYQMSDRLQGKIESNLPHSTLTPVEVVENTLAANEKSSSGNLSLADALFHGAETDYLEGDITESEEIMKETDNPVVWNEKGNIHFQNGDYEQAIVSYNKAIELDGSFGWSYSNLALTYVALGKFTEAALIYRRSADLLKSDLEKASVWNALGSIYRHINEYDNAVVAYQKADELDPHNAGNRGMADAPNVGQDSYDAQTWLELGDLFQKTGSHADAVEAYGKSLELEANSAQAFNNMAVSLATLGKYKDAAPLYMHAIELYDNDKDRASCWNRLGNLYRRMNDHDNALNAYKNAARLSEDKPSLLERARFSLLSNCLVN